MIRSCFNFQQSVSFSQSADWSKVQPGLILVQFRTNTFTKAITKNAQVHDDICVKSFLDKIVNYLLAEDTVTLAGLMV